MSNPSLPARGTALPFSHKSIVSITHEQNIICNTTLICRQLFAGHVVSSQSLKKKEKIHRMGLWQYYLFHIHKTIVTVITDYACVFQSPRRKN